ncbi:PucR family transcriptional regulator ligand-binding domain-containing protein [Nocardioides sp. B-3]|uniref:PucR family transcriptional regulator ligand-binding domain-containing protein n=1 Tax=Nocardioides sp. B-3 TaxID=2895565 RepID=UPI00215361F1|nr:PucR family transcriptional regulator ligand-binding domain-containing protein [Nocardioides sp. B-3]UUZ59932.1 PucR family transcriptional regulator ligand-binding domain-containing protein [Nocardioides sp. B-3]
MFTVRALLSEPGLGLQLVAPGREAELGLEVLWLHNTELPDPSPYIRASELVLTNGLWIGRVTPADFVHSLGRGALRDWSSD